MKILVTGSQGYLGSVLTAELAKAGYDCLGYDTGFFLDSLLYPAPTTRTLPLDVRELAGQDLSGVDVVVHLAGISNDPMGKLDVAKVYDPTRAYTFRLAEMCKKHKVKFIFASSCSIYGIGGADLLDETSPVHPQTGYSLNKLQIESDLATLSGNGFDPIALRFATVFGLSPRIRFDVVINMLAGMAFTSGKIILNSDGQAWRPNLHILDLCQSVISAIQLNNEGRGLEILNVGCEENNMRILDIAKTVQRFVPGSELNYLSRKVKDGAGDTRT
jgi:nucleoside-diphosphate-sugar epimerase